MSRERKKSTNQKGGMLGGLLWNNWEAAATYYGVNFDKVRYLAHKEQITIREALARLANIDARWQAMHRAVITKPWRVGLFDGVAA